MTSEVVVMNRLGIALASDSAATVYVNNRPKVYHADKLFMLSNYQPVGAMVYNNSSLLGVPWETILKMYRAKLSTDSFDRLEDYSTDLISFLTNNEELFPEEVQISYYLNLVSTLFSGIRKGIRKKFIEMAEEDGKHASQLMLEAQAQVVEEALNEWRDKKDVDIKCFGGIKDVGNTMAGKMSDLISKMVAQYFQGASNEVVTQLYELARLVVDKEDILPESLSGLVIAGYGSKDHFPVMVEYELGEIFLGRLKYKCGNTYRINQDTPSVIKPFAQSEMVNTFLHGISEEFELMLVEEIIKVIVESPGVIIDGIKGVGKKRKDEYKKEVLQVSFEAAESILNKLNNYRQKKHLAPILQSIEYLPKNELAHVASSLVNLSSFQKRMTISEDETVGGPIDVAVISKGDGFVWIDRKHYFRPELNRHFFGNQKATILDGKSERNYAKEEGTAKGSMDLE